MKTPLPDPRLAAFPAPLRTLLQAELAAGNTIAEVASSFPAPPAGCYVKLAKEVSTRPRQSGKGVDFYDRNSSLYSGEWTDAKRFYFVIEPPRPPPPEPDMDAIRRARNSAEDTGVAATPPKRPAPAWRTVAERRMLAASPASDSVVRRFQSSMSIDYEKWHDGVGYDLTLLAQASPAERKAIEQVLLEREAADWRDIEALAALKTKKAIAALKAALKTGNAEIRGAVLRYAPELVSDTEKTESLIKALRSATIYGGLSAALDQIEEFHPPVIVEELLRGLLTREGEVAVHFAAMLMFVHGKAPVPFDWDQRPFFLAFNTPRRADRVARFRELCAKIGVDPKPYIAP